MTPRQARWGVDVFTGAVVVSAAFALASLTWRMAGEPGIGPAAAPVVAGGATTTDIQPLIALAPFGTAVVMANQGSSDGAVTLRAIFLASPMEASVVLLATADGQVASYGVGAAVGGGVIESIEAEQVVLRTAGGLQIIGFNPEAGMTSGLQSANVAPPPAGQAPNAAPSASPVPRSGADAIRALIPTSTQGTAVSTAAPRAAARTGRGFRIGASPPAALVSAGIRPGDLIQRVNGAPVDSSTNETQLMAQSMSSGSAQVELLRNGQPVSLTISVR